jgi:hypothetical protein
MLRASGAQVQKLTRQEMLWLNGAHEAILSLLKEKSGKERAKSVLVIAKSRSHIKNFPMTVRGLEERYPAILSQRY